MASIDRQPAGAAQQQYDLIIIGGGIYGAMLSLEACQRGLRSLLLERGDFGEHTSFNSLRIIHGGLRYLQTLDLHRFRESVGERRWFLKTFPDFISPMPCLMPLYGDGLRRRPILATALRINDFLSKGRNRGVRPEWHLPRGKLIDVNQTRSIFPAVNPDRLKGGAIWYDACMPNSQRLLITVIKWACGLGATALNYVEALKLLKHKKAVAGVSAVDRESGETHEYHANVVINAAGPWCRDIAARFDQDQPSLFQPSLMWNVLLDREALSHHAIAVTPRKINGQTYFMVPWKGKLFAGTGHVPWEKGTLTQPKPSTHKLREFLDDLNLAVPGLELSLSDILHVFPGLLPVTKAGGVTLTVREVILDHGARNGPSGLWSVSGVKFTTARLVAEKTLRRIFPREMPQKGSPEKTFHPSQCAQPESGTFDYDWLPDSDGYAWKEPLQALVQEESVQHLDDLIFRRTTLWENPSRPMKIAPAVCDLFEWNSTRCSKEIKKLGATVRARSIG